MKSNQASAASRDEAARATLIWGLTAREAAILAGILVVTVAIYIPSLRNGWVFDDRDEFVENSLIHSWSFVWKSFIYDSWWFRDPHALPRSAYYRPLENVWFAANAWMFGLRPVLWHLAKIVLHLVVIVLSFRVAQLLTGDAATALLTAAIFAVMPANVDPVVWASAIPEPLSTAFELGAMTFIIGRKPGWSRGLFAALFLYALAMFTHETAILFPLIVAAYVFLFENRDDGGTIKRTFSALRACLPFVAVAIVYLCARLNALGLDFMFGIPRAANSMISRGVIAPTINHSPAQVLMTLPVASIVYLGVLTLPGMAGPTHLVRWVIHPQPQMFIAAATLTILAAVALALAWRSSNRRIYLFCAAWSLLTIAPALNLNNVLWPVDDRYLYAPAFGWSLIVALTAVEIASIGSSARRTVGAAMAVLLVAYAISTMQTERYWHDDVTFFGRCVEISPNEPDYRLRLAAAMNKANDAEGAARVLERGTELAPDDVHMHLKLAEQYKMMGRVVDFQREFVKFNELSAAKVARQRAGMNPDAAKPADAP